MTSKARIAKLEEAAQKKTGGDNVIIVYHSKAGEAPDENQIVTVNGEKMTLAESRRRWPGEHRHIFVVSHATRKEAE